jgi:hypothetical protein
MMRMNMSEIPNNITKIKTIREKRKSIIIIFYSDQNSHLSDSYLAQIKYLKELVLVILDNG